MIGATIILELLRKDGAPPKRKAEPFWKTHWLDYLTATIVGVVLALGISGWFV